MKVAEYVSTFNLKGASHFDRDAFLIQFSSEFESNVKSLSQMNPKIWENTIIQYKQKWDNIFNKSKLTRDQSDKFWGFFFATKVIPVRNSLFPGEWKTILHEYRIKNDRDYRIRFNRKEEYKQEQDFLRKDFEEFQQSFFNSFFKRSHDPIKQACIILLNLQDQELTEQAVIVAYRNLAKTKHPDVGGSQEEFVQITEAKDKLLELLKIGA